MPWRNSNFLEILYNFIVTYGIAIGSFVLAMLISIFTTAKKHGKVDWLEAIICGLLTLAIASILGWLKLPEQLAIFVGGLVGFKGSTWVDTKFNKFYDDKTKDK